MCDIETKIESIDERIASLESAVYEFILPITRRTARLMHSANKQSATKAELAETSEDIEVALNRCEASTKQHDGDGPCPSTSAATKDGNWNDISARPVKHWPTRENLQ